MCVFEITCICIALLCIIRVCICVYVVISVYVNICTYIYAYLCMCMYCIYLCVCVYVCVYVYIVISLCLQRHWCICTQLYIRCDQGISYYTNSNLTSKRCHLSNGQKGDSVLIALVEVQGQRGWVLLRIVSVYFHKNIYNIYIYTYIYIFISA